MYRHIKNYTLKFTDVDAYDRIKLSSLLSFLEESACLSAAELGFGYDDLSPKNFGFILVNVFIKFEKQIKLGDVLTVHTWPLRPSRAIFLRDSELFVGNEKVGAVTARWCMVDTQTFAILPATAYFKEDDFKDYNTERSLVFTGWKIPQEQGEEVYSKKVTYSDYDHYFHVNNTKYGDFCMDAFGAEELKDKFFESVQISYVKQCKEGETIVFSRTDKVDGYHIIEGRVDGEIRVQFKVKFNEL